MNEVRPRTRRARPRVREIQGMLAMHGLESETDATERNGTVREGPPTRTRAVGASTTKRIDARPLAYRSVLAVWPDDWRERWGRRATELQDGGLSWRDAESRAFVEIWSQWKSVGSVVERN